MRGRILAVLPDHPWPADMGSRVRNLRILETLAERFDLTIVTLVHDPARLQDPGPVSGLGRWIGRLASHRGSRLAWGRWHAEATWAGWLEGLHRETFFQSLPTLALTVERLVSAERFDLVHAAYWYGLRRFRAFPHPPVWVVDTHDVQFERHARLLGRPSDRERRSELAQLMRYDRIVAITERDRGTFQEALPVGHPPIEVIGMGLDLSDWRPDAVAPLLPPAPRVVYYGNLATTANQEGLVHLLRDLWPGLRTRVPETELLVIGPGVPETLRRQAEESGARVTGFVPDPRPWLVCASLLLLPLREGSGQRGRAVEAIALGVPAVGYPGALAGLEFDADVGIILADDPASFVEVAAGLLRDGARRNRIAAAGRARVETSYSLAATYGRFVDLYTGLIGAGVTSND